MLKISGFLVLLATPTWAQVQPPPTTIAMPEITVTAKPVKPPVFVGPPMRERYCQGWDARGIAARGQLDLVKTTIPTFLATAEGREIFDRIADTVLSPQECPGAGTERLPAVVAAQQVGASGK
jgi:hypothetical protein